jgi:hypothetical protein
VTSAASGYSIRHIIRNEFVQSTLIWNRGSGECVVEQVQVYEGLGTVIVELDAAFLGISISQPWELALGCGRMVNGCDT